MHSNIASSRAKAAGVVAAVLLLLLLLQVLHGHANEAAISVRIRLWGLLGIKY